jgi:hypothetical protein
VEGVVDRLLQLVGRLDGDRVLDHRRRHADHVGLLEGVGAEQVGPHLTGHEDGRRRVHVGVADRRQQVGRAGAGGREGDADAAGRARVALRRVAGACLVAHQHVADRRVGERVVDRQVGAPGDPEDGVDALALEGLRQGVGAAHRALPS